MLNVWPDAVSSDAIKASQDEPMESVGIRVDHITSFEVVFGSITAALRANRPFLMTFANPATAIAARRFPALKTALHAFDMVGPDGIGMVLAMHLLHRHRARPAQRPMRISFDSTSLAPRVFALAAERGYRVALVGGAAQIAKTAASKIRQAHPGIEIVLTADGYCDPKKLAATVIRQQPKIVIVGMGTLMQERFLLHLVAQGWIGLGFTCGGYLDQLAQKGMDYYPAWVDRYELRWAYRLIAEPGRLWRRYLLDYPQFGLLLGGALLRRRLSRHNRTV